MTNEELIRAARYCYSDDYTQCKECCIYDQCALQEYGPGLLLADALEKAEMVVVFQCRAKVVI